MDTIKTIEHQKSLTARNLAVGYHKKILLQGIELCVEPGRIVTLIGPNGSGKSTVLKTITRQLRQLGGEICIGTRNMDRMKDQDVAKEISMVMTEPIRTELLTGRELVATGRYPYTGKMGILSKEDWERVDAAMQLTGAKGLEEQDIRTLSDGQRQRLMLARAICQDTGILILDEPTSYLDMGFKLEILKTIRMLAKEKKIAVLMSLHELDLAQKVSDTIACVKGDRIDRIGSPEQIFSGDYIQRLYGVEKQQFDPITGQMFPDGAAKQESPQVFVIGGGGSGIAVYQRLNREQIPFAAGILQENDVEYATALAYAGRLVAERAFYPVRAERIAEAKAWIDRCESCICTLSAFGPLNEANHVLLEYAKATGKYRDSGNGSEIQKK